jgi:hypothetical protein
MNTKECCNHDCNQGRDCIWRKETLNTRSYLMGRYDTSPVKKLTDEEILKMASDKFHYSEYKLIIEFAKAILQKAQEK